MPRPSPMDSGRALIEALITGRFEGLSEETLFLFARSGLAHVFSPSGFHLWVAFRLCNALSAACAPLLPPDSWARKGLRLSLRLCSALFFGYATGWSSPFLRAFLYAALQDTAEALELQPDRRWIFVLSLLGAALLGKGGPLSLLLTGCAMAGLLFLRPRNFWTFTLGPWLCTMPLTIWAFGLCPLLAPLWNLTFGLAISWLVLPLGLAALLLRGLHLPDTWLENPAEWLMCRLMQSLARAELAIGWTFWVRPWPWACLVLSLALTLQLRRQSPRQALALGGTALLLASFTPRPALTLLDVGQGDSLLLRTRAGIVLADFGPPAFRGGPAPASRALESRGEGSLDDLLLSHFDLDHRGGLDSLLARHRVRGALWLREQDLTVAAAPKVLAAAERAGVPVRFLSEASAPPQVRCWLAPFSRANDSCPLCLAHLLSGDNLLLTGDMSFQAEDWYLARVTPFPQAYFLKVAHHGSRTSSSPAFLLATGAREALVSTGVHNRYHHPHPDTLARLDKAGLAIERTDLQGTVAFYRIWQRVRLLWAGEKTYFADEAFTEESMRVDAEEARGNPGREASTSRP